MGAPDRATSVPDLTKMRPPSKLVMLGTHGSDDCGEGSVYERDQTSPVTIRDLS